MKTNQLKSYLLLWSTQSLSALGSAMTSYALILRLFLRTGSALKTALLTVSSYAPYVLVSIFAVARVLVQEHAAIFYDSRGISGRRIFC